MNTQTGQSRIDQLGFMPTIRLGGGRDEALASLGLGTARELLSFEPLHAARMLMMSAKGQLELDDAAPFLKSGHTPSSSQEAVSLPVSALRGIPAGAVPVFEQAGVQTIADLTFLGREVEETIAKASADNGFNERPSAPAALLPGMIGSATTSVRYATFVQDTEFRDATYGVRGECTVPLPISTSLKMPGTLAEIFVNQKCGVIHLGYICDHRQRWINLGTHLGEVVHSISLAPGESRNIAMVNWRRRQLTSVEQQARSSEQLSSLIVQNRALEEITTAVAREHQAGRTQSEANTAATAVSMVGSMALVGGVAGGATGATIGGIIGSAVPAIGTAIGAAAGGVAGAFVGGAAGTVAGGLVWSQSEVLGSIEADTRGDRMIAAEAQQRIALSTSQTASAVRSLWSTAVVEDVQAESVEATTSNITNYNHMHSLNIQYYEVLQHYLARIDIERVQPVIYLPFTFINFTGFRFVRDYWDAVREHIGDEGLVTQGDAYFVTEGEPEAPDLLPVPPMPTPPGSPEPLVLRGLQIDLMFNSLPFNTDMGLTVRRGTAEVTGGEVENGMRGTDMSGYDWGNRYHFNEIHDAEDINAVILSRNQLFDSDVQYRIRVHRGSLFSGDTMLEDLRGQIIASNRTVRKNNSNMTFELTWKPAASYERDNASEAATYASKKAERDEIVAENARRIAAYEALVESLERFRERLERLILRRRHFFTRVILNAIEPEEISQLLESLTIGHEDSGESRIPLSTIAHTVPVGMTAGAFVLKLRHLDTEMRKDLRNRLDDSNVLIKLLPLLKYAAETIEFFDRDRLKKMASSDHVYVPTGGLFAEAILGRANSAEYLDMERYFNWQDSPIPHQPPGMNPISTDSRFQQADVSVNLPEGTLQVINPVDLPDPVGLSGVLSAIKSGDMFRDMSKASELANIINSLATLSGKMGEAASTMTGKAAEEALKSATEAGKAAAALAQRLIDDATGEKGGATPSMTLMGAALNKATQLKEAEEEKADTEGDAADDAAGGADGDDAAADGDDAAAGGGAADGGAGDDAADDGAAGGDATGGDGT